MEVTDGFSFYLFLLSFVIIFAILSSKLFFRFGFPILFIFLCFGMLAGSEGIGGIEFSDYELTRKIGVFSLCFILFLGGLETDWESMRKSISIGVRLSLIGTVLTALILGFIIHYVLPVLSLIESFLLASIISATDAASVFQSFKTSEANLSAHLRKIIEFESGSNDAVGTVLTILCLNFIISHSPSGISEGEGAGNLSIVKMGSFFFFFFSQIIIGLSIGFATGKAVIFLMNKVRLGYDGLYLVFISACIPFIYGSASVLQGNGFLAVYVAGLVIGQKQFIHKKSSIRFLNGFVWILQIGMFLCFGLLVFPTQLSSIWREGVLIAIILCFVARPFAVWISLVGTKVSIRERHFISWTGLRGASPIILATFPVASGIPSANIIFDIVFFVVLISLILQGSSMTWVAKKLGLLEPTSESLFRPQDFDNIELPGMSMQELIVPYQSYVVEKSLFELSLPTETQILLVARGDQFLIPSGNTQIRGGDVLWILARDEAFPRIGQILMGIKDV